MIVEITQEDMGFVELDKTEDVIVTVHPRGKTVALSVSGYNDKDTSDDFDATFIELQVIDGKLQLMVWGDINQAAATVCLSLEGAKKSARRK